MKDSDITLDTSFIKNTNELPKSVSKNFVLEEAMELCTELESMVDKRSQSIQDSLNKKLATGRCSIRDNILFFADEDDTIKPIWFPAGNAIEWQRDNGKISSETANTLLKNMSKLEGIINSDLKK